MYALSEWDLVRMLPVNVAGRIFANGFPGAGNVLIHRLCANLLEIAPPAEIRPAAAAAFLGPRHDRMAELLRGALPPEWPANWHFSTHRGGGRVDFVAVDDDQGFLMAGPFDLGIHLNAVAHASHELPTATTYELFESLGIQPVPVVRHPLDSLAAIAAKYNLTSSDQAAIASAGPVDGESARWQVRRRVGRIRLSDERWLTTAGEALHRFYIQLAALQDRWPAVRYEDAMADPQGFVASLAQRLQVASTPADVTRIAALIGKAAFAPGHFNQPGIEKWRRLFQPDQIALLDRLGLFETFAAFGYDRPSAGDLVTESDSGDDLQSAPQRANPVNFYQYMMFAVIHDPAWVAGLAGLSERITIRRHGHLRLVSDDPARLQIFADRLTEQAQALAVMPPPPAPVAAAAAAATGRRLLHRLRRRLGHA